MILLQCPHCGKRNAQEFRYGGELNPRPQNPESSAEDWTDHIYMRANRLGLQTEWWYHRAGCGRWFLAERHTLSNEVRRTYLYAMGDGGEGESGE